MAFNRKKFASDLTTGFGTSGTQSGGRFYRKDGSVNVVRKGIRYFGRTSWFHTMLSMNRWRFLLSLCSLYILVNLAFAGIYTSIGISHLAGVQSGSPFFNFAQAFFFSAQTFTTVGYGHVSPDSILASTIATLEAFLGLLSFALACGLFYGRFSRPRAFLQFSNVALIAPYREGKALMLRMVSYKDNHLTEAEVRLTIAMRIRENGEIKNEFYPLNVEFSKITSLVLNWTIVHPINESSPIYQMSLEELKEAGAEVLVFFKAYDEVFSNSVIARTSYLAGEIIEGAKFKPMYHASEQGDATVLHVDRINDYERVHLD